MTRISTNVRPQLVQFVEFVASCEHNRPARPDTGHLIGGGESPQGMLARAASAKSDVRPGDRLSGGLTLDVLLNGTEQEVHDMARRAVAEAGRRGFVLVLYCVIQGHSPDANLAAARRAVEGA